MGNFRPKEVFRQAQDLERRGRKKTASQLYASLGIYLRKKAKLKESEALLQKAIELSPESPRLYLQLALCLSLGDEPVAAVAAMKQFTDAAVARQNVSEYRQYLEAQLEGKPALKRVFYEGILTLDRTSAENFISLAQNLVELKDWGAANRVLLDALKTRTHDDEVIHLLRTVLEERGNTDGLEHLNSFISGKVPRDDLVLLLSEARSERKREPPPIPKPEEEKNLQTLIREMEVEIGVDLEADLDAVKPLVREFRRKSSKVLGADAKARIDMALAFYEMGLMEDARDELRPILPVDPLFLEAQCLLADILVSDGSDLGALEVLQGCLRDERASKDIRCEAEYKLVQVYLRLNDKKSALHHALTLEKRAPNYREIRRLRAQIQESGESARETEPPKLKVEPESPKVSELEFPIPEGEESPIVLEIVGDKKRKQRG